MKAGLAAAALGLGAIAAAQTPNVAIFSDLYPSLIIPSNGLTYFRLNSVRGEISTVGLKMALENGVRIKAAQRLSRVSGDPEALEEVYIENPGQWRIGRQYLPFGRGLVRECVAAAMYSTTLVFDEAPIDIAVFDAGSGFQRGVSMRVGRALGISGAVGNHLGLQGTTLTELRGLERGLPRWRGYKQIYGADGRLAVGSAVLTAEYVQLRDPETMFDFDRDVSDISASVNLAWMNSKAEIGWQREWKSGDQCLRLSATVPINPKMNLTPRLRFNQDGFRDFSLTARVRL